MPLNIPKLIPNKIQKYPILAQPAWQIIPLILPSPRHSKISFISSPIPTKQISPIKQQSVIPLYT